MTPSRCNLPAVDPRSNVRSALDSLERQLIDRALTRAQGNRSEAATLLGLDRAEPRRRMD